MASYKIAVVNEADRPLKGVTVEALDLSDLTISTTAITNDSGQAIFTSLVGPHWFRPRTRRVTTKVGGRTYIGQVKVQVVAFGESMNVDYVVDSNGMGTHTSLFGATGALTAALAAGGRRVIWLCTTHTEPNLATPYALGTQAVTKIITIWGAPGTRSLLPIAAASASSMFTYHQDTDLAFIFKNIRFALSSGTSFDMFSQIAGGTGSPQLSMTFDYCDFSNVRALDNTTLVAGLANNEKNLLHCTGTLVNVLRSTATSGFGGEITIEHCNLSWTGRIAQLGDYSGSWTFGTMVRGGHHTVSNTEFYVWGGNIQGQFIDLLISFSATGGTLFTTGPNLADRRIGDYTLFQNLHITSNRIDNKIIDFPAAQASWGGAHANENAIVIDGVYMRGLGSAGVAVNAIEILIDANTPDVYLGLIGCAGDWLDCYVGPASAGAGSSDHGFLNGLSDDDHSQYVLLAGRAGGQVAIGGTAAGEDFTIQSTSSGTRGSIFLGSSAQFELNETTGQLLLPTQGLAGGIIIGGDVQWYRSTPGTIRTPNNLRVDGTSILTGAITSPSQLRLNSGGVGFGIRIGGNTELFQGGADVLAIASGDVLRFVGVAGDFGVPLDGMISYNTTSNRFRVRENAIWVDMTHSESRIRDADNDTQIQVEESADEDIIRFDVATVEVLTIAVAGQLALPIQGSGAGILLGGDVQLYRSAAGIANLEGHEFLESGTVKTHRWDTGDEYSFDTALNRYVLQIAGVEGIVATPTVVEINAVPVELEREITLISASRTFTSRLLVIETPGAADGVTTTLDFFQTTMQAYRFIPTIEVAQDANGFGLAVLFNNQATFKNQSGTLAHLGPIFSFVDQPIMQADGQTIDMAGGTGGGVKRDFLSQPRFETINGGVLSLNDWSQFIAIGRVTTGATVATRIAFDVRELTFMTGTLTTQIGLDIAPLSLAGTNIGIRNASTLVHTPQEQIIGAAGDQIRSDSKIVELSSSIGSVTLTNATVIANGQDGQELTLINIDGVDTITIPNGNNTRLAGAANLALGPADSVTLTYSVSLADWVQTGASNN